MLKTTLIATLAAIASTAAADTSPGPQRAATRVYVHSFVNNAATPLRSRPSTIHVEGSGGISYRKLHLTSWGARQAHASGSNCSSRTGGPCRAVRIRLFSRTRIHGRLVYRCLLPLLAGEVRSASPSRCCLVATLARAQRARCQLGRRRRAAARELGSRGALELRGKLGDSEEEFVGQVVTDGLRQQPRVLVFELAPAVVRGHRRGGVRRRLQGTTDPEILADLARGRLRQKVPVLREALVGAAPEDPRAARSARRTL